VHGYVRLRSEEAKHIADHLDMDMTEFTHIHTRLTDDRTGLSLIERDDGSCIFLSDMARCMINEVKPRQCKDFPHAWNFKGWEQTCEGYIGKAEG
jgi:Fe-S-cluster containining protein